MAVFLSVGLIANDFGTVQSPTGTMRLETTQVGVNIEFPLKTTDYHLELSFDFKEGTHNGLAKITITNQSDLAVFEIPLLLYRLMNVSSVTDLSGRNIQFSQKVVQFIDFKKQQVNHIIVEQKILPSESKTIILNYDGFLLGYSETGMRYITDRISSDFTLIREDAFAYPLLGKPSKAIFQPIILSSNYNYTIEVTVPDSLVVANGGILESINANVDNQVTYRYRSKQPGWRIDIAIAPYKIIQNEQLNIYYYNDSVAAQNIVKYGRMAFSLYENLWGKLKDNNGITIIETERGSGGQASETTILLPSEAFSEDNYEYLFHEISHLWNVRITEKQGLTPRWDEGLAQFCQYLLSEILEQKNNGLLKRTANWFLGWFKNALNENEKLANTPMIEYGNEKLTGYSYYQPMLMFTVLYYWFGEEVFHNVIGGFYKEYYDTGASTKDFTEYWEKITQSKHIQSFFDDWVYSTNYKNVISDKGSIDEVINYYSQR